MSEKPISSYQANVTMPTAIRGSVDSAIKQESIFLGRRVRIGTPLKSRNIARVRFSVLKVWTRIKSIFKAEKNLIHLPSVADLSNRAAATRLLFILGGRKSNIKNMLDYAWQLSGVSSSENPKVDTAKKHLKPALENLSTTQLYRLHRQLSSSELQTTLSFLREGILKADDQDPKFLEKKTILEQQPKIAAIFDWMLGEVSQKLADKGYDTVQNTVEANPGLLEKAHNNVTAFLNAATRHTEIASFRADPSTIEETEKNFAKLFKEASSKKGIKNAVVNTTDSTSDGVQTLPIARSLSVDLLRMREPIIWTDAQGRDHEIFTPIDRDPNIDSAAIDAREDEALTRFSQHLLQDVCGGDAKRALALSNLLHQGGLAPVAGEILVGTHIGDRDQEKPSRLMSMRLLDGVEMPAFQSTRQKVALRSQANGDVQIDYNIRMRSGHMPGRPYRFSEGRSNFNRIAENIPRFDPGKTNVIASFRLNVPIEKGAVPKLEQVPVYSAHIVSRGFIPGTIGHSIDIPSEHEDL